MQGRGSLAGVHHIPDPVLTPGAAPVPQFEVGELPAFGVGDERGELVAVRVGEPELRAGAVVRRGR
jgi:hypothetical protein